MNKIFILICLVLCNCYSSEYVFATWDLGDDVRADIRKRVRICFKANGSNLQSVRISKPYDEKILVWTFQCDADSEFNNIVNYVKNNNNIQVVRLDNNMCKATEIVNKLKVVKLRDEVAATATEDR